MNMVSQHWMALNRAGLLAEPVSLLGRPARSIHTLTGANDKIRRAVSSGHAPRPRLDS